jgi:hypothetical protein
MYGSIDENGEFVIHLNGGPGIPAFKMSRQKLVEIIVTGDSFTPPGDYKRDDTILNLHLQGYGSISDLSALNDAALSHSNELSALNYSELLIVARETLDQNDLMINILKDKIDLKAALESVSEVIERMEQYENLCTENDKKTIDMLKERYSSMSDAVKDAEPMIPKPRFLSPEDYRMEVDIGRRICSRFHTDGEHKGKYCGSTNCMKMAAVVRCNPCSWISHSSGKTINITQYLNELADGYRICGYATRSGYDIHLCGYDGVVNPEHKSRFKIRCEGHQKQTEDLSEYTQDIVTKDNIDAIIATIQKVLVLNSLVSELNVFNTNPTEKLCPGLTAGYNMPVNVDTKVFAKQQDKLRVIKNKSLKNVYWPKDEKWRHLAVMESSTQDIFCIGSFKGPHVTIHSVIPVDWESKLTQLNSSEMAWLKTVNVGYDFRGKTEASLPEIPKVNVS